MIGTDSRFGDPRVLPGLALRGGSETRILSRNQKDLGGQFPEVKNSIAALDIQDAILDGEIVARCHWVKPTMVCHHILLFPGPVRVDADRYSLDCLRSD